MADLRTYYPEELITLVKTFMLQVRPLSNFDQFLKSPANLIKPFNLAGALDNYGREPKSCLGRVFSFKLGSFTDKTKNVAACKWPLLKLKTRPRFCPVS